MIFTNDFHMMAVPSLKFNELYSNLKEITSHLNGNMAHTCCMADVSSAIDMLCIVYKHISSE